MIDDRTRELVDAVIDRIIQHKYPERTKALVEHIESQYRSQYEKGFAHGVSSK